MSSPFGVSGTDSSREPAVTDNRAAPADADGEPQPGGPLRRLLERLDTLRHRRVALRTRILLSFALGGLALSAFLAATTYSFTKSRLVRQRDQSALTDAYKSASLVTGELKSNPADPMDLLSRLQTLGVERPVLYYRGDRKSTRLNSSHT